MILQVGAHFLAQKTTHVDRSADSTNKFTNGTSSVKARIIPQTAALSKSVAPVWRVSGKGALSGGAKYQDIQDPIGMLVWFGNVWGIMNLGSNSWGQKTHFSRKTGFNPGVTRPLRNSCWGGLDLAVRSLTRMSCWRHPEVSMEGPFIILILSCKRQQIVTYSVAICACSHIQLLDVGLKGCAKRLVSASQWSRRRLPSYLHSCKAPTSGQIYEPLPERPGKARTCQRY